VDSSINQIMLKDADPDFNNYIYLNFYALGIWYGEKINNNWQVVLAINVMIGEKGMSAGQT